MGTVSFFGAAELGSVLPSGTTGTDGIVSYRTAPSIPFPWGSTEFAWQDELYIQTGGGKSASTVEGGGSSDAISSTTGTSTATSTATAKSDWQWAVILFDTPTLCLPNGVMIGSKLDTDLHAKSCRIAFYGNVMAPIDSIAAK